jgi:CTP synthase (UTP-ammonia lyase)
VDDATTKLRIAIVGDFDSSKHSHWATEAALFHAAIALGLDVEPHWIPTSEVSDSRLVGFDGMWGAPGSPYASMLGMLSAIETARSTDIPFLGTCGGFQYALIEFTRNVLGFADADSAENGAGSEHVVITPIGCALRGTAVATPVPGSLLARLCADEPLRAEYFCSFETNAEFVPRWEAAGLRVSARGADGEMRAFELPHRRFFVATLFQPQLASAYARPHPIILGYLRACALAKR